MSPHVRRLSLPFILAFVIALIACQASAAPVPTDVPTDVTLPSPPPPNPGMTMKPSTVYSLECGGPPVPKDAIIDYRARYPENCDGGSLPPPTNIIPSLHGASEATNIIPSPRSVSSEKAVFSTMSVTAQASQTADTEWGWTMLNQNSKAGLQGQLSVQWPLSYNPLGGRQFFFQAPQLLPANNSCLEVGTYRVRNDPSLGTQDFISAQDLCTNGVANIWTLTDPNVQSTMVRNDQWGSPIFYAKVEQTAIAGNCFATSIYNYTTQRFGIAQTRCGTGPSVFGRIRSAAGPLETPTLWCPGSVNPYANALLKKDGVGNWVPVTPSDTTFYSVGHCTTAVGPGHYATSGFYDPYGFWPIFLVTPYP